MLRLELVVDFNPNFSYCLDLFYYYLYHVYVRHLYDTKVDVILLRSANKHADKHIFFYVYVFFLMDFQIKLHLAAVCPAGSRR